MRIQHLNLKKAHNGIRLSKTTTANSIAVEKILALPCNVYFLDTESKMLQVNKEVATTLGFHATKDMIGRTMLDIAPKSAAEKFISNDRCVVRDKNLIVCEETADLNTGINLNALSFKFPWYSDASELLGVFGFAIVPSRHSIPESLNAFYQLGLLNNQISHSMPLEIDNITLTKRQRDCLAYLIKGKTSKEIAEVLGLSQRTVENYIYALKIKLNVNSKSELIDKIYRYFNE